MTKLPRRQCGSPQGNNIFKQYVAEKKEENRARPGSLRDEEADNARKLNRKAHSTRLEVMYVEQAEQKKKFDSIYELRYTRPGHKMCMKTFENGNISRSQPDLLKQARKLGHSPEAFQLKMLGDQVPRPKPKTPIQSPKETAAESLKRDLSFGLGCLLKRG